MVLKGTCKKHLQPIWWAFGRGRYECYTDHGDPRLCYVGWTYSSQTDSFLYNWRYLWIILDHQLELSFWALVSHLPPPPRAFLPLLLLLYERNEGTYGYVKVYTARIGKHRTPVIPVAVAYPVSLGPAPLQLVL